MGARILVIEDNAQNLELMTYLLEKFGHEVLPAVTGEEALDIARRETPDLVICDLQLPGMDGIAVLRQLRRVPALARIPVLAVTAYAMVGDRDRILAEGFDAYLPKPIDPHTFVAQLESLLPASRHGARPARAPQVAAATRSTQAVRATILAVDNTHANLELARSIFEGSGYRVLTAASGRLALDAARAERPDIILSDLHMPDGDGYDLLEWLRGDPQLRGVPVIIASATVFNWRDEARVKQLGAKDFIMRPIEPSLLLVRVEDCLSSARGSTPGIGQGGA